MRKKPFAQGRRFYLGGRRKQKGGFFMGPALGIGVSLVKKLFGGKRKRKKEKKEMVNRRNNIVLVKRDVPKRVVLPNGRTFMAKYRRVNRQYLPGGTTIARTYRGQPVRGRRSAGGRRPPARAKPAAAVCAPRRRAARGAAWHRGRRQGGKGLTDVVKAVTNNLYAQEIGKRLIAKGKNSIPSLFKRGTSKIKNKHLRKIAQSDIVTDLVDEGTRRLHGGIGI